MKPYARLLLFALAAPLLCAQKPTAPKPPAPKLPAPDPPATASLHGVVRDEITQQPLAGARVKLVWLVPHAKIPRGTTATTLSNGSYRFTQLAAHPYFLVVEQPHYLRRTFFASALGEGQIDLLPDADREIDLSVLPEAGIEGTVTDAAGAPVAGVTVAAIRERNLQGVFTYDYTDDGANQTGVPSVTDRNGHYRVASLPAGTYAVLALLDRIQTTPTPAALAAAGNGSLPVYLGGGFSLQHAARVTLNTGMTYHANFKLAPHKRHMIRGTLHFTHPPEPTFEEPLASMDEPFDGPRNFQPWQLRYDRKTGAFELGPLVAGDYDLTMATGVSSEKDQSARRSVTVADTDVEHVDLTLSPRFSLNARIVTNHILPRGEKAVRLQLHRDGEPFLESGYAVDRTGALAFPNLEPGHYTLHLFSEEPFVIQSARFAGQDIMAHGFTLKGPPSSLLEVTLGFPPSH